MSLLSHHPIFLWSSLNIKYRDMSNVNFSGRCLQILCASKNVQTLKTKATVYSTFKICHNQIGGWDAKEF